MRYGKPRLRFRGEIFRVGQLAHENNPLYGIIYPTVMLYTVP